MPASALRSSRGLRPGKRKRRLGWGGSKGSPSSVEETALAVDVLVDVRDVAESVNKGIAWLVDKVEQGGLSHHTPIGFYFAKLWYYERLYPLIWTVGALGRVARLAG